MRKHKQQRGFTLLEIMLVMILVSVSAIAVIINLPRSSADAAEVRAQQLFQRLTLLHQDAILNGWDLGIRFDPTGKKYRLLRLTKDGWQALDHRRIPADTELEDGLVLAWELGDGVWGKKDSLFKQGSLFDEEMFAEEDKQEQEKPPQAFILSSGELTPFEVYIHPNSEAQGDQNWRVFALENGSVKLLRPGEDLDDEVR
ncbi:type II secretion system protein GspH [Vibrio sp. UCD-FRSSP16_10]|uniref:type II secretion system minor pseudopilin GspH n=1 Tax=unclassified Vibrio TaxID=2614977 RepID=UPI0007FD1C16|nr:MULTISPECIES: type II secretion system minor pseudopilin GspH [unclassified Vibrio]OBT10144.1 type II secretion system protein GspH [Vibrio sp. UCD-FRSSP16_30]OBT18934.1 type II secretion system protein GspH [Vibrio sp. UCD-FRSSP16_10]